MLDEAGAIDFGHLPAFRDIRRISLSTRVIRVAPVFDAAGMVLEVIRQV
jgi:hypothetical protein